MTISLAVSSIQQTGSTISAGTAAGSLKSAYRTFSLTGTKGTTFLLGDEVQLWGSNDGGSTYQPLNGPKGAVLLTYGSPEVVINDSCDHYATQRTKVAVGSALAAVGGNGEDTGINPNPAWVQGGNSFGATGVLGTQDANPLNIIAESQTIATSDGTISRFGSTLAAAGTLIEAGSAGLTLAGQNGAGAGADISLLPGTASTVRLLPRTTGAGNTSPLQFMELLANGSNSVGFKAPDAIAADVTWVLPNADATISGQSLKSNAAGALSWGGAVNVQATNANAQSIADGASAAAITTWTEVTDSAAAFNNTTGVFTAPVAGFYYVDAQLEFSAIAAIISAEFTAQIFKNGSAVAISASICPVAALNQKRIARVSLSLQLAASDTIDIRATQNSGSGANTLTNVAARNTLSISQIS